MKEQSTLIVFTDPPPQPITQGLRELITEMVANGVNRADVVRILNQENPGLDLTYTTVYFASSGIVGLKRNILRAKRFVNGQPRQEVIQSMFFEKNMKMRAIADELHVDYQVVWAAVDKKRQKLLEEEAQAHREVWSPQLSQTGPVY